jgi:hypothetical protein
MKRTLFAAVVLALLAALIVSGQTSHTFAAFDTANVWTGSNSFSQEITSTVSTRTAPLSVASTTQVSNFNAQFHGGFSAPASAIVGISDTQTLTSKTLTAPTITSATLDGVAAGHAALQVSAATNFGTTLSTQTVVSSVPVTGPAILEFVAIQTLAGVGCSSVTNSAQVSAQFTSPGGTAGSATFTALSITGNGAVDSGNNAVASLNVVKAGTTITYTTTSTLSSTGCSTVPQYTIFAKAFF